MFSLSLRFVFACSGIVGVFFLLKCISRLISLYNSPFTIEFSAKQPSIILAIRKPGTYEISVRRSSFFGIIPYKILVCMVDLETSSQVAVIPNLNLMSQRTTMSGERIIPVLQFKADKVGSYQLENLSTNLFRENDKLLIMPETGVKGLLLILGIIFFAILFIGGLVLTFM